ncbi:TrkH family potassium uptake protein [Methanopyrus sp.]
MDVKLVSRILGTVVKVAAVLPLLPLPVSIIYGEFDCIAPLLLTSILMFVCGAALERIARVERHVRPRHAIVAVPIIWLVIPLFTSLPYHFCEHMPWLDAYFESMSGWTTTGLTVLPDIDHAHRTILFWRSLEQWVGGLGIVVSIISILRFETPSLLYVAEAREERIRPNVVNTAKEMWKIYITITVAGFLALWAAGMNPFDALNHSMTAVATGGFSTRSESVAAWNSPAIELITVILMVLGATSFVTHYRVAKTFRTSPAELPARIIKALRQYLQDRQFLTMIGLIVVVTAYVGAVSGDRVWDVVRYYGYQVVSAITCCGFSNADVSSFPEYAKLAITVLMIVGGSTASTAGAIKILRFLIMAEAVKAAIARRTQPIRGVVVPRIGSRVLSEDEILDAFAIASAYVFFLLVGTLLLTAYGYPLVDALFEVASAQGGVGLSSGITTPNAPTFVKILLIFHMWIGRLEVLPCLAALYWLTLIPKRLAVKGRGRGRPQSSE